MFGIRSNIILIKNGLHFGTNTILNTKRLGRIMKKLMGTPNTRQPITANASVPPSKFKQTSFGVNITGSSKRVSVLNKLFMRNITDVMTVSEYSEQIRSYGIEFERIKITSDYKILKIYWTSGKIENDDSIIKLLHKCSGFLRHELSQLHLMGQIPTVVFVRDRNYFKAIQVEDRLTQVDVGEYEGKENIDMTNQLKFEEKDELHDIINANKGLYKMKELDEFSDLCEIPDMSQNILGLNHARILDKIRQNKSVAEGNRERLSTGKNDWAKFKIEQYSVLNPIQYANSKEQRAVFKEFLHKRQILKNKERRREKKLTADQEYFIEVSKQEYMQLLEDQGDLYEEDTVEDVDDYK